MLFQPNIDVETTSYAQGVEFVQIRRHFVIPRQLSTFGIIMVPPKPFRLHQQQLHPYIKGIKIKM